MSFFARLESIVKAKGTCICVGLDPRVDPNDPDPTARIVAANRRIIEATAPYTAAYKPNMAFYEAFGPAGLEALKTTLGLIPDGIPVLLDAKRCDIGPTAEAYARSLFGFFNADAVTLSPYMGRDAVEAFLSYEGRGAFVLCRTSNPDAGFLQDLSVRRTGDAEAAEALYLRVAKECTAWSPAVGLVVAGNDTAALRAVRAAAKDAWFLAPGIGAQGGRAEAAFAAGARADGLGILVVAARSVADAADPAQAARALRDTIEEARLRGSAPVMSAPAPGRSDALKADFLRALIATECFKLGDFVLKSGKRSPFYIDLRRLVSDPAVLRLAAEAYARLAAELDYDRIAGIPAAALPLATAASLRTGRPLVWPRMPVKEHGTGNRVEGAFRPGDRALLLDDLITTGASKLEAVAILRGEGLLVTDLVVLIERGGQGREDMAKAGIRLHSFIHVRELFAVCEDMGMIDAVGRRKLEDFVEGE